MTAAERGRLEGIGIVKRFGGLTAVDGVSVETKAGTIAALIGPNGAGKTTLFQCLTGVETPDDGQVLLNGRDITARSPDARARLGIGRTFQQLAIFETHDGRRQPPGRQPRTVRPPRPCGGSAA